MQDKIGSWGQLFGLILGWIAVSALIVVGLHQAGILAAGVWPAAAVMSGLSLVGVLLLALMGQSGLPTDLLLAGRAVPAAWNGLAVMAQWAGGAVFFGYAGLVWGTPAQAYGLAVGWSVGFLLMGVLFVPYLRRSGAPTLPDFLARRFPGPLPRALSAFLLAVGVLVLLAGAFTTAGLFAARVFGSTIPGIGYEEGVIAAMAVVLLGAGAGGMRSLTLVQAGAGVLVILAFVVPALWLSWEVTGQPVPQLGAASLAGELDALERRFSLMRTFETPALGAGFVTGVLSMALLTASGPASLTRFVTTPTVSDARASLSWALFFIALILVMAPTYAVFAKADLLSAFGDVRGALAFDGMPPFMTRWSDMPGQGLLVCGAPVNEYDAIRAACGEAKRGFGPADLTVPPDIVLLMTPELTGMPYVLGGLLMAGGLAAILSTAGGFAYTLGASLAHDLFAEPPEPGESGLRAGPLRLFVATGIAVAGYLALVPGVLAPGLVGWAVAAMGAGLFPALVLAIWDARSTSAGASAAMVMGAGLAVLYTILAGYGPDLNPGSGDEVVWFGLAPEAAALLAVPAALALGALISRLTPAPGDAARDEIEGLRTAGRDLGEP